MYQRAVHAKPNISSSPLLSIKLKVGRCISIFPLSISVTVDSGNQVYACESRVIITEIYGTQLCISTVHTVHLTEIMHMPILVHIVNHEPTQSFIYLAPGVINTY